MTRESAPIRNGAEAGAASVRAPNGRSPFVRTRELIGDTPPGKPPISLAVGEPQHPIPAFVGPVIAAHVAEFGRYPANKGLDEFGVAVAGWLGRRYRLARPVDPASEVLALNGTREGLFLAALAAKNWVAPRAGRPAMLIPNPFYAAYAAGAIGADCEPVYLPTTRETGFLPDLDALDEALLARTVAFYIASPSNPQGAVADLAYLEKLTALARRFGFLIFSDECYCEIYSDRPPHGMLEAAGRGFRQRRRLPLAVQTLEPAGLAHRLCRRRPSFMRTYLELRNVAAPMVPTPMQHVAIAAYNDEKHVEENRRLYREKFDLADQIVGDRYGYRRPAGGFFLWLDVVGAGRQRSGDAAAVARGGTACRARPLSGARTGRRLQSRRRLYPRRHGA